MSDTTHEAPERIWAAMMDSECARNGTFVDLKEYSTKPNHDAIEYVRADLVQAAVAAALKEAAQAIQGDEMLSPVGAHRVSARILTFITPDAQAALDRVKRKAYVDGSNAGWTTGQKAELERRAKVAQRCADLADTNGDYLLICNVVAAIRKGGE